MGADFPPVGRKAFDLCKHSGGSNTVASTEETSAVRRVETGESVSSGGAKYTPVLFFDGMVALASFHQEYVYKKNHLLALKIAKLFI